MVIILKKEDNKPKQVSLFEDETSTSIPKSNQEHPEDCDKCPMRQYANRVVWGNGAIKEIVVIGEAPGENEDKGGVPFIGASGKLVREVLGSLDVFITNSVKCRPPNNRQPDTNEVLTCSQHYIPNELKDAKIVVLLGKTAESLKRLYPADMKDKFIISKPHPSYALRKGLREEWIADFQNDLRYFILMSFDTLTAYKYNKLMSETI